MVDLSGRVAIVTGGGTGLGRGTSMGFARAGAAVAVAGIDDQSVDDILAVPDDFYAELGLAQLISPLRLRGMSAMLARIKRHLR